MNEENSVEMRVNIAKADNAQKLVYGVVLEPETVDAHQDKISEDEIQKSAHGYLVNYAIVRKQHDKISDADVVESYIAPCDFELEGQTVKKGSWIMVTKVHDDATWEEIQKGEITGYSVWGYANREEEGDEEIAKGGPGSGRHPEGGEKKEEPSFKKGATPEGKKSLDAGRKEVGKKPNSVHEGTYEHSNGSKIHIGTSETTPRGGKPYTAHVYSVEHAGYRTSGSTASREEAVSEALRIADGWSRVKKNEGDELTEILGALKEQLERLAKK